MTRMFEQRGWSRTGLLEGPAPVVPSSMGVSEVLVWADRAPVTGAWVDALAAIDPASLSGADRVALVRAWDRFRRGMDAGFAAAVGAIAARPCTPEPGDPSCDGSGDCPHDWSGEDMSLALGVGRVTARMLLEESRELTRRLPGLLEEVAQGRASFSAARRAAARTAGLADAVVDAVAQEIAGRAAGRTVGAFDRLVATVIDRHRDPAEVAAAHAGAVRSQTGIRPTPPLSEGMAGAVIIGPAEKIAALFGWARQFTRLNRHPDDQRTVGQRRLDALLAGILDPQPAPQDSEPAAGGAVPAGGSAAPTGAAPTRGAPDREAPRQRVALQLVLAASTLLGQDDEPGWLEGHGDLAAPLACALAVHPETLQRLLTQPLTGHLLDLTPEVRVPSAALDRYIRARDGSCAGPACAGSARHAEIDHITPVAHDGPTTRANLHAVCKRSHRQRHPGGWTVRRNPEHTETWTDPHGNSYTTEPTRYPGSPIDPARTERSDATGPAGGGANRTRHPDDRDKRDLTWVDYDDLELGQPPPQPDPDPGSNPLPEPPCPF